MVILNTSLGVYHMVSQTAVQQIPNQSDTQQLLKSLLYKGFSVPLGCRNRCINLNIINLNIEKAYEQCIIR